MAGTSRSSDLNQFHSLCTLTHSNMFRLGSHDNDNTGSFGQNKLTSLHSAQIKMELLVSVQPLQYSGPYAFAVSFNFENQLMQSKTSPKTLPSTMTQSLPIWLEPSLGIHMMTEVTIPTVSWQRGITYRFTNNTLPFWTKTLRVLPSQNWLEYLRVHLK